MRKHFTLVFSLGLVVALTAAGCGKKAQTSGPASPAEERYMLDVADANKDGTLSSDELARYRELQQKINESNGELMISENGELEIADKFAHDEEARAAFEERQHAKDM